MRAVESGCLEEFAVLVLYSVVPKELRARVDGAALIGLLEQSHRVLRRVRDQRVVIFRVQAIQCIPFFYFFEKFCQCPSILAISRQSYVKHLWQSHVRRRIHACHMKHLWQSIDEAAMEQTFYAKHISSRLSVLHIYQAAM